MSDIEKIYGHRGERIYNYKPLKEYDHNELISILEDNENTPKDVLIYVCSEILKRQLIKKERRKNMSKKIEYKKK